MNIREVAQLSPNYYEINREERNYASIFFAALCRPGNIERFLHGCGYSTELGTEFGIYFEYAYLRDLWNEIDSELVKKNVIRHLLEISGIEAILELPIVEINRRFGVAGKPSERFIQCPGNWSIAMYNRNFSANDDFLKICRFKWSFNIKPDIVIHLDKDHAICIEAKFESGEGLYPSSNAEKNIFKERGVPYVGQMELQKYMMENLLGVKTNFIFLVYKKQKSETHKVVSWADAFGCLDLSDMPRFAVKMVEKISMCAA